MTTLSYDIDNIHFQDHNQRIIMFDYIMNIYFELIL